MTRTLPPAAAGDAERGAHMSTPPAGSKTAADRRIHASTLEYDMRSIGKRRYGMVPPKRALVTGAGGVVGDPQDYARACEGVEARRDPFGLGDA
jgi:hypothetical protein